MATTANVFQWLQNYSNKIWGFVYGQSGEKGWDVGLPWGSPIGSPVNGTVTAVYSADANSSIGYIVQIKQQGTIPGGISGGQDTVWHFQHLMAPSVSVGQQITAGQVLGYSGGCPPNGYGSSNTSCSIHDQYSTGPHIEVREAYVPSGSQPPSSVWGYNWINPQSDLNYYAKATGGLATKTSPTASPGNIPANPNQGIPNPCGDILASAYATAAQDQNPVSAAATRASAQFSYTWCVIQQDLKSIAIKLGLFLLAVILILVGGYVVFRPELDSTAIKAAEVAA